MVIAIPSQKALFMCPYISSGKFSVLAPPCSRAFLHNLQLTSDRCLIFASQLATRMIPAIAIISRLLCLQGMCGLFKYFPKNDLLSFCCNMKSSGSWVETSWIKFSWVGTWYQRTPPQKRGVCRELSARRGHADTTEVGCGRFTVYCCGQTSKPRPSHPGCHCQDVRTRQCTLSALADLCGYLYHGDRITIIWVMWYANILYYRFSLVPDFFPTVQTLGWRGRLVGADAWLARTLS